MAVSADPKVAVAGANVIVTDTWVRYAHVSIIV